MLKATFQSRPIAGWWLSL